MIQHLLFIGTAVILLFATWTDLRERLIYDRFVLSLLGWGFLVHFYEQFSIGSTAWMEYGLSAIGVFLGLAVIAILTGGRSIGGGDIKLFAAIAFTLGFEAFLCIFFVSHLLGAFYAVYAKIKYRHEVDRKWEMPFAPFILLGLLITYGMYIFI
ncbi:leader peptidase (prepilin peptidase) / N-methyltransferase [Marininema mesophilum]|uniref:Leader peptidase (Prepilin peptidase) / N-methyltransferase n=1 Tax=Marininema mesophilum TaxID=1048340 RepID=A0A1H2X3Z0_9BACL|nr:prepilin peptidase [Marininema mesophilum]SDW87602.1 leader peptidase (prepilin peptidase) / N-methyltransferase [Marininema mesophilum]